ncbi:hypothetical protein Adt_42121 [Abeliophyllum distichum]|uniref:Uncharacterized protein n=1 Tax=Abeliophyllum distichum TaxID=126358 RepID=A0ABD1PQW9_9LAMI
MTKGISTIEVQTDGVLEMTKGMTGVAEGTEEFAERSEGVQKGMVVPCFKRKDEEMMEVPEVASKRARIPSSLRELSIHYRNKRGELSWTVRNSISSKRSRQSSLNDT